MGLVFLCCALVVLPNLAFNINGNMIVENSVFDPSRTCQLTDPKKNKLDLSHAGSSFALWVPSFQFGNSSTLCSNRESGVGGGTYIHALVHPPAHPTLPCPALPSPALPCPALPYPTYLQHTNIPTYLLTYLPTYLPTYIDT